MAAPLAVSQARLSRSVPSDADPTRVAVTVARALGATPIRVAVVGLADDRAAHVGAVVAHVEGRTGGDGAAERVDDCEVGDPTRQRRITVYTPVSATPTTMSPPRVPAAAHSSGIPEDLESRRDLGDGRALTVREAAGRRRCDEVHRLVGHDRDHLGAGGQLGEAVGGHLDAANGSAFGAATFRDQRPLALRDERGSEGR